MFGLVAARSAAHGAPAALVMLAMVLLGIAACSVSHAEANPEIADIDDVDGPPSVELLLRRYVEAVGGRDAILGLHDRVAEMRCVTDLQWDTHIYEVDTLTVYGRSSGEYLVVTRTDRGVIMEGFDGDKEWKIDTDESVLDNAIDVRERWMTDPQFPLRLHEYFPKMRSTGIEAWNEDRIYAVDVDEGESHRLGFDVETGLLVRLGYKTWLDGYEEVDGVLIPRRVVHGRKGGSTTFITDAIQHNTGIDRTVFSLAR